ncbi:hypothetical protein NC653_030719 [Populus alba x Populus x berolinensis]|uniref:Uncharacterized protein n=1 Tax=Populus alba x Populus x berolinensis TaxID=444605 RepID=A0AAD6LWS5_9ROSI|nr:hypothetical protein NC653_030719 [Populus alba x Populus x berolinensis]
MKFGALSIFDGSHRKMGLRHLLTNKSLWWWGNPVKTTSVPNLKLFFCDPSNDLMVSEYRADIRRKRRRRNVAVCSYDPSAAWKKLECISQDSQLGKTELQWQCKHPDSKLECTSLDNQLAKKELQWQCRHPTAANSTFQCWQTS